MKKIVNRYFLLINNQSCIFLIYYLNSYVFDIGGSGIQLFVKCLSNNKFCAL
jgi:hypothetical protein